MRATFVDDAGVDIELAAGEKTVQQRVDTIRTVNIDRRLQPKRPSVVGKRPRLKIVIGMVVRDENVAQRGQREFGFDEFERRTVTHVDDVGYIVPDKQIDRRARRISADRRPAFVAEKHKPIRPETWSALR